MFRFARRNVSTCKPQHSTGLRRERMTWQTIPRGRARPMNKLTPEQRQDIREAIEADNKRIEHERTHVFILAKRHPSLRPSVLAARYKVTYSQIKTAMKGLE